MSSYKAMAYYQHGRAGRWRVIGFIDKSSVEQVKIGTKESTASAHAHSYGLPVFKLTTGSAGQVDRKPAYEYCRNLERLEELVRAKAELQKQLEDKELTSAEFLENMNGLFKPFGIVEPQFGFRDNPHTLLQCIMQLVADHQILMQSITKLLAGTVAVSGQDGTKGEIQQ